MFRRVVTHIRRQPVAFVALFFALGGGAVAASNAIQVGTPASGDLTGTYPSPSIAANAVNSGKVSDNSLTDADIATANKDGTAATPSLRTLGTGAQQAAAGNDPRLSDARTPTGAAGGDLNGSYPNPSIADGSITTSKFASSAQVPDSAKVGGKSPNDYGAVMSGRINGLTTTEGVDFGAVSGFSSASATQGGVTTLSPNHDLVVRDLSVKVTASNAGGFTREIYLVVNGNPSWVCIITPPLGPFGAGDSCTYGGTVTIPANSELSIEDQLLNADPSNPGAQTNPADLMFAFRLTP